MAPEGKPYPIEFGGLDTTVAATRVYPRSPSLQNVHWKQGDILAKRTGFVRYSYRAMTDVSSAKEQVTGLFKFNKRDTTTRYTIACTPTRIMVVKTTDADWTELASSLALSTFTDYWDAAVFNNEMILVNGKESPRITDGTAAGTGLLTARAWQTKTASPVAQSRSCGMKAIDLDGELYDIGGSSNVTTTYDGFMQVYDPQGDSWRTAQRMTLNRIEGQAFQAYGKIFVTGGRQEATTYSLTGEMYNPETGAWSAITSMPLAKVTGRGMSTGGFGYSVCGSTDNTYGAVVATNYKYDPAIDAWTTATAYTTARRYLGAFEISGRNYIVGGQNSAGALLATTQSYDTNAGALVGVAAGSLATATDLGDATAGNDDGKGYFAGGELTGATGTAINDVYSFDFTGNAWTAETDMTTASVCPAMGTSGKWIYVHGGESTGAGAAALATMQRMNTSPSAPTATYIEAYNGYLLMARSSAFPSRVWYSGVGDARYWDPNAFFDVNPDDGDWITGMFSYEGRLYVTKIGQMYQVTAGVFNPEEGDIQIVPIEGVPGAVSNRSIVPTDHGVYYLAKDGVRLFDGARSTRISEPVQSNIDSFTGIAGRANGIIGVWKKDDDEVWFSQPVMSSSNMLVYNTKYSKWSKYAGIQGSSMAIIEDGNEVPWLVFGKGVALTGDTRDGFIYKVSGDHDVDYTNAEVAIDSFYQTGWFSPSTILTDNLPSSMYLLMERTATSGNATSLTVTFYRDYGTTVEQTDTIATSGTTDPYFQDLTDRRCRIQMGAECGGHAMSFKIANNAASRYWQIEGAIMVGKDGSVAGNP